jgi:hypothetical protein
MIALAALLRSAAEAERDQRRAEVEAAKAVATTVSPPKIRTYPVDKSD